MQKSKLYLYGTSACHLCEQANAVLLQVNSEITIRNGVLISWEEIDIANDDALLMLYGLTIPVLRLESGDNHSELNWPFASEDVVSLLANSD